MFFSGVYKLNIALVQSKRVKDKEMEMQAKMWQKDEKLRQLKEIVQVYFFYLVISVSLSRACSKVKN